MRRRKKIRLVPSDGTPKFYGFREGRQLAEFQVQRSEALEYLDGFFSDKGSDQ